MQELRLLSKLAPANEQDDGAPQAPRRSLFLIVVEEQKEEEEEKDFLEPLPILRYTALIVDNGSGMCWLVLLVTIHLVLCFRLLSMPVAIPQVQFLVKVTCPLLSCLMHLVRQRRKLWLFRSCISSTVFDFPFRSAEGRSRWSRLFSRSQRFSSCCSISGGRCPCCTGRAVSPVLPWRRSCRSPQLQLVEKSPLGVFRLQKTEDFSAVAVHHGRCLPVVMPRVIPMVLATKDSPVLLRQGGQCPY